jgi:tRNA threonylcarbamoyladenosine biosynthesis protein TsaB
MKILALDTSSPRGSIALLEDDELTAELRLTSSDTHSARLLSGVEYLLSAAGWKLEECGLIAAGIGPGSFTGIRIGVATALGLAQSIGCALAPVSGLDALASAVARLLAEPDREGPAIAIAMDASRGQIYYAEYRVRRGRLHAAVRPSLRSPDLARATMGNRRMLVAGDGAVCYAAELGIARGGGRRRLVSLDLFLACPVGRLALSRKRSWVRGEYLAAEPLYIRPPDALVKRARAKGRGR